MRSMSGIGVSPLASRSPEWRLMGVVRGPREVDPRIHSDSWVAWARGPKGERVDGQADSAQGALNALANEMRKSGQAFKVE